MFTPDSACAPLHLLMLPLLLILVHSPAASAVEPSLIISAAFYHRNTRTSPNTIEMPYNQTWQLACRWTRRNATETPFIAIEAPGQSGLSNCQFSTLSGPAVCTPSSVQFQSDSGVQKSNLTCTESGNTLTCSISFSSFNPRHIAAWSCKSLSDGKDDTILLQYYKTLPRDSLVLASWNPMALINETDKNSSSLNSFECFTKIAVIPPARLTFYLGGIELTQVGLKYPIERLSDTVYTVQPSMYTLNASATYKTLPRSDLSLKQQVLASNRILEMQLHKAYNGLILQCVANQNLSDAHQIASQEIVLHLDGSTTSRGSSASIVPEYLGWQLPFWLVASLVTVW